MMADCVPVVLYDPEHHALGLAHAGWRGTVKRICSRTVETMTAQYGTDPAALIAAIGPSIGPERYEVGENVIAAAREAYGDAPILRELGGGKALFDLWAANEHDLRSAGRVAGRGVADLDRRRARRVLLAPLRGGRRRPAHRPLRHRRQAAGTRLTVPAEGSSPLSRAAGTARYAGGNGRGAGARARAGRVRPRRRAAPPPSPPAWRL